jgi:putative effector of murein hydrolase
MRNSKAYARFKAANSILFVVLGAAIVYQMLRTVGLRFEAVPGIILGAAMFALGIHRAYLVLRVRQ